VRRRSRARLLLGHSDAQRELPTALIRDDACQDIQPRASGKDTEPLDRVERRGHDVAVVSMGGLAFRDLIWCPQTAGISGPCPGGYAHGVSAPHRLERPAGR
jgi:hypothetical protein